MKVNNLTYMFSYFCSNERLFADVHVVSSPFCHWRSALQGTVCKQYYSGQRTATAALKVTWIYCTQKQ